MVDIEPEELTRFMYPDQVEALCKGGCPNYRVRWSCPPFAPLFTDFVLQGQRSLHLSRPRFWLILENVATAQFFNGMSDHGCSADKTLLETGIDVKTETVSESVPVITPDLDGMTRIFVRMKELLDDLFDPMRPWGIPVSGGTCLRCSVCQCQMNKPCLHPERMSYSLEALRLNVEEIAEYYFDQRLTWFDGKTVPPRLSLLGGFLTGCTLENLFS